MFNVALAFSNNISSGPSQAQFDAQAAAGLNCQLEYVNSTTVKFSSKSGATISVITPDLKTIDITTSGLTATVSGSTSTLYYVYLNSTGISFSTSAPSTSYSNMKTLSGTKILIGYMGCSGSNAIAGTYNIFSYWNEPQRSWTQSTTTVNSTALALNGFVLPTGKSVTVGWSGSVSGQSRWREDELYTYSNYINVNQTSLGTASSSVNFYYLTLTRSQTLALANNNITSGVTNTNLYLSGSVSNTKNPSDAVGFTLTTNQFTSISGTITLTRPGS